MRANLALACLHNPKVLFLDEPTIGLDITSKEAIRQFLLWLNREYHTTILLTTHDMTDIEQTCQRIVFINEGEKCFDGPIGDFQNLYSAERMIQVTVQNFDSAGVDARFSLQHQRESTYFFTIRDDSLSDQQALAYFIGRFQIEEIAMYQPGVEETKKTFS